MLFFWAVFSVAQSSLIDQLHTMQVNPRLKEKVFVHTNKTAYFPDDVIWFKAYVGDSLNQPSVATKILEVNLFDNNGTQIFSKKVAITDGSGHGQIELNDAIAPGIYYLQARTNYMRNYGEEHKYLQEITVLGKALPKKTNEKRNIYDLQLLPESGNLLENIENTVGIKVMVNGKNAEFDGVIVNEKGELVTSFKGEHEGMGKCRFYYKNGETYRAQINIKDTLITQAIPTGLKKGVSLSVDNSDEDNLKVYLKTNEATFYDQIYSNYTLLYHQDRQLFELVSVARLDSLTGLIETKKNIFLDGVHTVTLFADDQPIAQRKFFIETGRKQTFVTVEQSEVTNDSITYLLSSKEKKQTLNLDLSIAVLHENSEVATYKNTIKSAFMLSPHVKGYINKPAYYFNTKNKKRKEHLDLLLLTQGWTRYSLKEMIEEINPTQKYAFETGFELKGEIKEDTKHKKLVLIPKGLRIMDKASLKDSFKFVFQNLNVTKGDTVRVAYQNWLGKIIKPEKIAYDTVAVKNTSNLSITLPFTRTNAVMNQTIGLDKSKNDGTTLKNGDDTIKSIEGTIDLDEVTVTERKRSEQYLARRKVIQKYEPVVSDIGKYYDLPIPEAASKYNTSLMEFIGSQGYRPRTDNNVQYFLVGYDGMASLYINGKPVAPEQLPSIQLQINDIENVMTHSTVILRPKGRREKLTFFQVFTKDAFGEETTTLFDKFIIKNGFDRAKNYYKPLYVLERSRPSTLTEVDWKPNLKTNNKGEATFKISKDYHLKNLSFHIQGFSDNGHLISKTITID
ncbi:hypothetical protein ACFQZJ_17405 [Maribacter chungangensis]|uniref:Macroglobulin domain-containing protein n=1 Tax=Maribacter chungangensis TaxID=1069117 RepID=A0ABW3B7G8_9FLAO